MVPYRLKRIGRGVCMASEKKKLFLGVMAYGMIGPPSFTNLVDLVGALQKNYQLSICIHSSAFLSSCKNFFVKEAIEKKCDYLLILDINVLAKPETVQKLIEADKDFVSALFFSRLNFLPNFKVEKDGKLVDAIGFPVDKPFKVPFCRIGCFLAKVPALQQLNKKNLKKPLFDHSYVNDMDVADEDSAFCKTASENGFEIFVEPRAVVKNFGGIVDEAVFVAKFAASRP